MKLIIVGFAQSLSAFTLTLPQGHLGLFPGFGGITGLSSSNNTQKPQQFTQFQNQIQNLLPESRNEATNTASMSAIGDYGCWCYFASNNGYRKFNSVHFFQLFCS